VNRQNFFQIRKEPLDQFLRHVAGVEQRSIEETIQNFQVANVASLSLEKFWKKSIENNC
jgi:hypothetical protein